MKLKKIMSVAVAAAMTSTMFTAFNAVAADEEADIAPAPSFDGVIWEGEKALGSWDEAEQCAVNNIADAEAGDVITITYSTEQDSYPAIQLATKSSEVVDDEGYPAWTPVTTEYDAATQFNLSSVGTTHYIVLSEEQAEQISTCDEMWFNGQNATITKIEYTASEYFVRPEVVLFEGENINAGNFGKGTDQELTLSAIPFAAVGDTITIEYAANSTTSKKTSQVQVVSKMGSAWEWTQLETELVYDEEEEDYVSYDYFTLPEEDTSFSFDLIESNVEALKAGSALLIKTQRVDIYKVTYTPASNGLDFDTVYKQTSTSGTAVRFIVPVKKADIDAASKVAFTVTDGTITATKEATSSFTSFTADGEVITADQGEVFVGVVITGIPEGTELTCSYEVVA